MQITKEQVAEKIGIGSRGTGVQKCRLPKLLRLGLFPAPVTIGGGRGNKSLWNEQDIDDWLKLIRVGTRLEVKGLVYLSDLELARLIGRSKWTIDKWVRRGTMPRPDFSVGLRGKGKLRRYWNVRSVKYLVEVPASPPMTIFSISPHGQG